MCLLRLETERGGRPSSQDAPGGHPPTRLGSGGLPPKSDNNPPPQDRWRLPSSTSTLKGLRAWRPRTLPPHCGAPGLQLHIHKHSVAVVLSPGHSGVPSEAPSPNPDHQPPPAPQILPSRAPGQRGPASRRCPAGDLLGHPSPGAPPRRTEPPRTRRRAGGVANDARSQRARS